jgi:hypothetical protein
MNQTKKSGEEHPTENPTKRMEEEPRRAGKSQTMMPESARTKPEKGIGQGP